MEIARLEAIIGGDIKPLQAALGEAKTELKAFAGQATEQTFKPLNAGLQTTVTTTKTAVSGFKQMVTEMKAIALVGLGAGLSAGLQALQPLIRDVIKDIVHMGDVSKEVTEILKEQNDVFAKNLGNATEELVKIQALTAAARDENLTREQRNSALKNAQELYPSYLNNITLETLKSGEANAAINQLTDALVRKAKAEALASLVSQTYAKIIETQNMVILDNLTLTDKVISALKGFATGKGPELITKSLEKQATTLSELQSLLDSYIKQFNELTVSQAGAGDFIKDDDIRKLKKKKAEVEQILIDLNTNIKHIRDQFIGEIAVETGDALAPVERVLDRINGAIKVEDFTVNMDKVIKDMANGLGFLKDAALALGDAFGDIFKTLLTEGKLSFKAIENAIASLISKMVEAVIQSALLAALLSAFSGGALSFGSAFSQLIGLRNLIPHAEGGIFTQTTVLGGHVFGEKGPEVLMPLDRLAGMIGGLGSNNLHITGELRAHGTDLVVALNRGNVRINRNYGSNFSN